MNIQDESITGEASRPGLVLKVTAAEFPKFVGLLNAGFMVNIRVGESVQTVLCDRIGLDQSYFDDRIQTLFLNSKPVDDPTTAVVKDGAILALSAAMPGLVGATFRKGGKYRWMRGSISHPDEGDVTAGKTGWLTLKLFNLILKELGPFFLEAGIWLKGETIQTFFTDQKGRLTAHVESVMLNDRVVDPGALLELGDDQAPVYIKISPL